jgi:uncharacterized protein YndB with AHSA1/START domain
MATTAKKRVRVRARTKAAKPTGQAEIAATHAPVNAVREPSKLEVTYNARFQDHLQTHAVATWCVNQFIEELYRLSMTPGGVHVLLSMSRWAEDSAAEAASKLGGDNRFPGSNAEQAAMFGGLAKCLAAYVTPSE